MISREQILVFARSARLRLTDAEIDEMRLQMERMLDHLQVLRGIVSDDAEVCLPTTDNEALRADVDRPGLGKELVIGNASRHRDGCFIVPRVDGER